MRAAKGGDVAAVKLLLEHGALVDLPNKDGVTPLMVAAGLGHGANPTRGRYKTDGEARECSALLIAAGAGLNGRARGQITALHSAAMQGWDETLKLLVEKGAELEAPDAKGLTPDRLRRRPLRTGVSVAGTAAAPADDRAAARLRHGSHGAATEGNAGAKTPTGSRNRCCALDGFGAVKAE